MPPAHVDEPAMVYIACYSGWHNSLLIPDECGEVVEYTYGDWNFYAQGNSSVHDGVFAAIWPTRATLGRKFFNVSSEHPQQVFYRLRLERNCIALLPLVVEHDSAKALAEQLDHHFNDDQRPSLYYQHNGLQFVRTDDTYTLVNTCNHALARWLRALGCEVRGVNPWGNYTIRFHPEHTAAQPQPLILSKELHQ